MAIGSTQAWFTWSSANINPHITFGTKPERKPREEFMFGSEPIIAYRIWKVGIATYDSLGDFLGLLADAHDAGAANPYRWALQQTKRQLLLPVGTPGGGPWIPGVTEAKCVHGSHKAPDLQCECGFWGLRSEAELVQAFDSYTPDAWGTVLLWGSFCEFEKGYRAQYAKPSEITLLRKDEALAADLAHTYGCAARVGEPPTAVAEARKALEEAAMAAAEFKGRSFVQASQMWSQHAVPIWIPSEPTLKKWWQK